MTFQSYFPWQKISWHAVQPRQVLNGVFQLQPTYADKTKQGFKADGDFELAQSVVSQVIKDIQEKKPKLAVITAIADQNPSGFLLQILKSSQI
ncbi:hypothetical protein PCASD_19472 [Puccinia coronata f. sp. avenae]|uniref:Uncharacterized protein n=1 Tax=Puccinia coronata f. sp. avenae TaxID=200324 RepID=A0A2N5UAE7_9BASI|nr:hypothetical protein PCASD_19472 [Puccinia coronata f. sp. avenae]